MDPNEQSVKQIHHYEGVLTWLNDIEVNIVAYLGAMVPFVLGMVLIRMPLFEIAAPIGEAFTIKATDLKGFAWAESAVLVLNIVAIFMLAFPMMKFFEWKYLWFAPAAVIFTVESAVWMYLAMKKNDLASNILVSLAMELFSMEVRIAAYGWGMIAVFALGVLASIIMLLDIHKNKSIYIMSKKQRTLRRVLCSLLMTCCFVTL